jgi:hypothetical protein
MKKTLFVLCLFVIFLNSYGQKTVKMISKYGTKNKDITSLMRFQNITLESLSFESSELIGKSYEVNLKEYKKGKLVKTKKLLDGEKYIEIDSINVTLKFLSKIENDKMEIFIETERMFSDKMTFNLEKHKGNDYVLKDFQGNKDFINVSINQEFPILAIITPVELEKGYFSYCEIAQSEIEPEKFGEKFKIPHYFVITMKFK